MSVPRPSNSSRQDYGLPRTQIFGGAIILLAFLSIFSTGQIPFAHGTTPPTGTYFDHVVVIVMENEGIDNICGSRPPPCNGANNPFMSSLANNYTLALRYTSIPCSGCPASKPNYVALLSGSNQGCSSGGCPSPITAPNLVDSLESAGLTWKGYFENQILNGQPFQGCDSNSNSEPYNPTHNPFIVFQDITTNSNRCNKIVDANPSSCTVADCALVNDLSSASAPNLMWLTPNDCDNMHGVTVSSNCPSSSCNSINNGQITSCMKYGDNYLKSLIPSILNSNTFKTTRAALFITFDEGLTWCPQTSNSDDCVYSVWAGPQAKQLPNGFSSPNLYNHYSFVKTIESNWNLPSLTSNDAGAKPMTEFFQTQPDFTISANPNSVTFSSGSGGSFTATVSPLNGFTGTVTLSTSSSPSTGLSVGCTPTNISGGSGSSTCTMSSSTPGSYTMTITGTSGSLIHSATVSVTVTPASTPDFSTSANPTSLTIVQGSSGTSTISLSSLNSFSGTVSLTAIVSPPGPSASLNPSTVILLPGGAGSSILNITTTSATVGSYTANITGTSGSLSHSVRVDVSVNPPADFTIATNPNSLTLGQGSPSAPTPVTVTTSGDRTWFESSYLSASFYAQGLIWLFFEDSSKTCESVAGCLLYTTSSTGSTWATPTNVGVHVTDSDFSVYSDGTNVYYVRYDEVTFESTCGKNIDFRAGTLSASGIVTWQSEQRALAGSSQNTYPNDEIIVDSTGQAWIAFLSDSHKGCGGNGNDLPQIIHSTGTNYASWTTPFTLSTAHSNNWHIDLASLGAGQIYAAYWLSTYGPHGKLYDGTTWGPDEQISSTTSTDVNNWLFNSGTSLYMIYFDNNLETFNFASRSASGIWTSNTIGVGESRTGSTFSSQYYSFPDAASYDPTHNQFYLFWMNATLQRIDEWNGAGNSWTKTTKIVSISPAPYPDSVTSFITSSPTSSFPATGGIFYITGSSAPFTYNFVALPLSGSSSGTFAITVTSRNGFTGTVNLSTTISPPTGLTVNCNPTSITGGSGSSTCLVTGSTAGNYNVTVTGTSGSLSHSTNVAVSVQSSSPDFTISSNPNIMTVNAGASGTSTITVAPQNGFTGTVNLTVATNSSSLTCSLSPTAITGGSGSATLSCSGSNAGNYLATTTGTSGFLSHATSTTYQVQDFTVTTNPTTVSTTVNTAGTATVSVTPINGFAGSVTLTATTNSTNLACTLTVTTIPGGSGTSSLSCSSGTSGNYLAMVTGTNGGLSHLATVVYHVTNTPDFSLTATPTILTLNAGDTGNSTITVAPLNGFTGTVTLSVTTNSTNLSCSLSSTSITGGSGTSTLSCRSPRAGNYLAVVKGTSGNLSHNVNIRYVTQDFTIEANPTSISTSVGVSGNSTISVASLNRFTGTVGLGVTTNSSNLSCFLSSNSIAGGAGSSGLSCNGGAAGNFLATITGTSGGLSHSTTVVYDVQGTQDFRMTASPTATSVNVGAIGSSTITVTSTNGFSGSVSLAVNTNSTSLACKLNPTNIPSGYGNSTLSCSNGNVGNYLANVTGTSGNLSHFVIVTYQVQDFGLSADPTTVTTNLGVAGTSTITVSPLNGFTRTVALTVTANSTSLVCTVSPNSISGGSGISTLSCTGSLPGTYLANVTGTNGGLSHSTAVTYQVNMVLFPDFTMSANPTSLTVSTGSIGNSTITVTPVNGFSGTVTLTVNSNSTGLVCTLSPTTVSGGSGNSTLSCSGQPAGNYLATITGTSGSLSHSTTVTYHVQDFAITANPMSVSTRVGTAASSTVSVSPINGFSGNTVLTVSTNSTNLSCSLGSTTVPGSSGTSPLQCSSNTTGNYFANVTGTSGSLSHSVRVTFHVMAAPNFNLTANPGSVSVMTGSQGVSKVTVNSLNGFTNTVTLVITTNSTNLSCTLSATTITGGSGSSTLSCSANVGGDFAANVTGTSGSLSHSATVIYQVTAPAPDFTMSANPTTISIVQGSSGTSTITLSSVNGFSGTITLTGSIAPSGPNFSFNPTSMTLASGGTGSSTLNVTSAGSTPGTYLVNVTATSGSLSHSLVVTVKVSSATVPPGYGLVVSYEGYVYKLYPNNTFTRIGQPVTTSLNAVAWKLDGSCAVIAGSSAVLIKWDGKSLTKIATGISSSNSLLSISWRPDGSYALIGGSGGTLLKYDCATVTPVSNPYAVSYRSVSWNPGGTQALLVSYFGKIYSYSSSNGQVIQLVSPTSQDLDTVAWSPDGSYALLAGSGGAILKYNGTSFQLLNTAGLYSSTLIIRYVSFNPASGFALLVGDSGLVLTYNGSTLAVIHAVTTSILYSVSWSNGTAYIVGGSGAYLTYSNGTLASIGSKTFSGFRGISWKP